MSARPTFAVTRNAYDVRLECDGCHESSAGSTARAWAGAHRCEVRELKCCDGTGWTGNPRERCTDHFEAPGFGFGGLR